MLLYKNLNILEQNVIENYVEIIGVPEAHSEIIEFITESIGVKTTVLKASRVKTKIENKSRKIMAELQP